MNELLKFFTIHPSAQLGASFVTSRIHVTTEAFSTLVPRALSFEDLGNEVGPFRAIRAFLQRKERYKDQDDLELYQHSFHVFFCNISQRVCAR